MASVRSSWLQGKRPVLKTVRRSKPCRGLLPPEILVTATDCGLAQRARGTYIARHRVSAERLGLAAIDAPD